VSFSHIKGKIILATQTSPEKIHQKEPILGLIEGSDFLEIIRQNDKLRKLPNLLWPNRLKAKSHRRTKIDQTMLERAQLTVTSHLDELSEVQQWFTTLVSQMAIEHPWVNEQFDQLNLALAEGFTNAVRHAHANLPGSTPIELELILLPGKIEIRIFDQGGPFDPNSLSEPKPGTLREGGYGWFLLRRLADQVTYSRAAKPSPEIPDSQHCSENVAPENVAPEKETHLQEDPLPEDKPQKSTPQTLRNCLRIVKTSKNCMNSKLNKGSAVPIE